MRRYNRPALNPSYFSVGATTLCTLVLLASGCARNVPPARTDAPPASPTPQASVEAKPEPAPRGVDVSALAPPAQRELAAVYSDEFCYCGCPHTLGACLQEHAECPHAPRMAALAAAEAAKGAPATEIIVLLSKYYLSFRERATLPTDDRMCLGPRDAKVTLVEFSDFECPYCAAAAPLLKDFARKNGDVKLCYAPFPLQNHPNALPAAQAALFARDHGKFWEMHDLLFENQTQLGREKILSFAERLKLPRAELEAALSSGAHLDEIRASRAAGLAAQVDATPTVYVNGRKLVLDLSSQALQHTVEDELEWQAHDGSWAKD